jgi:hypothetical protein
VQVSVNEALPNRADRLDEADRHGYLDDAGDANSAKDWGHFWVSIRTIAEHFASPIRKESGYSAFFSKKRLREYEPELSQSTLLARVIVRAPLVQKPRTHVCRHITSANATLESQGNEFMRKWLEPRRHDRVDVICMESRAVESNQCVRVDDLLHLQQNTYALVSEWI